MHDTLAKFDELAVPLLEKRKRSGAIQRAATLMAQHDAIGSIDALDSPVHPFGPPSVTNTTITVEMMLNNPTRITNMIMDLSLQRFIADRIFASGGGVSGGAVIYDEVAANELYAKRDVQLVEPGAEFPIIETERRGPKVAPVEKWGGKVWIPDEARDRNQSVLFTNKIRQMTNTIIRKINQRAIAVLDAAIAANPGQVSTGVSWSAVIVGGSAQSPQDEFPARDIILASTEAEIDELGITYDLWLLNPAQYMSLALAYGDGLGQMLSGLGVSIYVSNRVTAGTAFAVAERQVGEMRVEKPLGTETWREPGREREWVQASVRPLMFVNNVFAIRKFTGIA